MSLADRTPTPKRRGGKCSVAKLYEQIPPDDAATLRAWLADEQGMEGTAIYERLKAEYNGRHEGHDDGEDCTDRCLPDLVTFGYNPLRRHRAFDCKCGAL